MLCIIFVALGALMPVLSFWCLFTYIAEGIIGGLAFMSMRGGGGKNKNHVLNLFNYLVFKVKKEKDGEIDIDFIKKY